jgi:hypothetical protein
MPANKVRIYQVSEGSMGEGQYEVWQTRKDIDDHEDEENAAHRNGISKGDFHDGYGLGLVTR